MLQNIRAVFAPKGKPSIAGFVITALVPAVLITVLVIRILQANSMVARSPAVTNPNAAADFTLSVWNGTPGEKIHLAALQGKPVVLNFWGSWCEPCQAEAPILSAAAKTYEAQGVVFIGVAYNTPEKDGKTFISQHGIDYACGPDTNGNILVDYGITALPQTVLIDRTGVIVKHFTGQITRATFDPAVAALAAGKPIPSSSPTTAPTTTPSS